MKDNEITSFDKELNEFLQPKCLIIQETPSLNWAFLVCIELMLYVLGYRTKSVAILVPKIGK